ncbi:hypothetical protein HDU86_001803 [Geranomyces michiganensis]|nr:hypothetical protein HDU86_001803 [Geranomyces michiganensis]
MTFASTSVQRRPKRNTPCPAAVRRSKKAVIGEETDSDSDRTYIDNVSQGARRNRVTTSAEAKKVTETGIEDREEGEEDGDMEEMLGLTTPRELLPVATITLMEYINEERLEQIIYSETVPNDVKEMACKVKSRFIAPNFVRTEYAFSKSSVDQTGRLFSRGPSLQNFEGRENQFRQFLAAGRLHDIDQQSSFMTIVKHYLEKYLLPTEDVAYFLHNRDNILAERSMTKRAVMNLLLYEPRKIEDDLFRRIHTLLHTARVPRLQQDFPLLWKKIKASRNARVVRNRAGSFLAQCTQTVENKITLSAMEFFERAGWHVSTLVFDGLMLLSWDDEPVPLELLREAERYVLESVGVPCRLLEKPLDVPGEFLARFDLVLSIATHPIRIDFAKVITLSSAKALAAATKSHVDFAKLTGVMSDGNFIYDGADFWQFTTNWRVVPMPCVRSFFDKVVAEAWTTDMKKICGHIQSINRTILEDGGRVTKARRQHLEFLMQQKGHIDGVYAVTKFNSAIKSIMECFQTEVYDGDFVKNLDTNPFYLGCNNGYLDIRTGTLHKYANDVLISKTVGYNYFDDDENSRNDALAKDWDSFVNKVFPIPGEQEIAQIYFGYCLRGDHPEKIFAVLKDRSGGFCAKSKVVQAIMTALGCNAKQGNNAHIYEDDSRGNQNGHNASAFAYVKVRLAVFEGLSDKKALDDKLFKDRHGGNSAGEFRHAYAKITETVYHHTKYVLIFNDKCQPKFGTHDEALLERMLVIPCRAEFLSAEKYKDSTHPFKHLADAHIADKFSLWRPYILEWLLEGYRLYEEKGFNCIPASCKEWKDEVAADVHNLEDFVADNIDLLDDDGAYLTLEEAKGRMPASLIKTFKNNQHIIDMLSKHLPGKSFVRDTTIGNTAVRGDSV